MKISNFTDGFFKNNPTFVQLLGMCPTLAVTTSAANGIGMGLATTAVLVCSNVVISMIKKIVPNTVRIPIFVVVISTFVTIVGMLMEAFTRDLFKALGLYIPLIVVNCIIFARAESFAFKNTVGNSFLDGLGQGLGFTMSITILSSVREIVGNGTIFGHVIAEAYSPITMFVLPPGAFIMLALLMAAYNKSREKIAAKRKEA